MDIHSHISERKDAFDLITVERIDYANPYDYKKLHRHDYFEFLLFNEGHGGKQIIDFEEFEITSKSIYLVLPGQVHLMKRLPNENGLLIQFSKTALRQSIAPYKINHTLQFSAINTIKLSDEQFITLNELFKKLKAVCHSSSFLKPYKLIHLLGLIILEIIEIIAARKNSALINNNCAYRFMHAVETHFKEIQTVKDYSILLNIPINKLTSKVKTHLGKSPLEIIHEALLIEIKRMMLVEQYSHKEICHELNFDSQSSYSRFIKKHTSLSPSMLKEQLLQIAQ